jgi:hypothetical protein
VTKENQVYEAIFSSSACQSNNFFLRALLTDQ